MRVAIRRIEGVEAVEVSLNHGLATITFRPENRVTVEQVRRAIRSNGFTPKAAEVRASGRIVEQDGRLVLAASGQTAVYTLVDDREAQPTVADIRSTAMGRDVTVEGRVPETTGRGESPLTLEVRRFTVQ